MVDALLPEIDTVFELAWAGGTLWFLQRAWATRWGRWKVYAKTVREGTILYVRRGFRRAEVGRVKFDRSTSANPAADFDEQFGIVMQRARQRRSSLNAVERNWRGK